jgi:DNA repair exonuclease SbcCD nuclease subunit
MTILITSDLSLTDVQRDEYRWTFLEKTLPILIKAEKADVLYVLGDLTEEKDNHGAWLVNRVSDAFYKLAQLVKDLVILRGNHDYAGSGFPFFSFLDMVSNVVFISDPTQIGDFLFLPHTTNYLRDWKPWQDKFRNFPLIFAHNTFEGAVANGIQLPGIPLNYFPANSLIIAGDVHTPQTYKRITYVGAPYTVDFGDDYKPRVLVINDTPLRFASVPVSGPQKRVMLVDTKGIAIKKVEARPEDILKVRIPLAASDYARWSEIRERVRDVLSEQGFIVHAIEPVVEQADRTAAVRRVKRSSETDAQLLTRYAKHHDIDEKTLKVGLELL